MLTGSASPILVVAWFYGVNTCPTAVPCGYTASCDAVDEQPPVPTHYLVFLDPARFHGCPFGVHPPHKGSHVRTHFEVTSLFVAKGESLNVDPGLINPFHY